MIDYRPTEILIERGEENAAVTRRALAKFPDVPIHVVERDWEEKHRRRESTPATGRDPFGEGKRRLFFTRQRARFLEHCPAGTPGMVCCNYLVVSLISNCPMDCSYCFLQEYLANNPTLKVFTNVEDLLTEVAEVVDRHPARQFRIGTGELSDSLALDPIVGFSQDLVPFFAARDNALLELKTKSACVDGLLRLDPRGRVVVSWTLGPPAVADTEEHGTASFAARLDAARRVQAAGYKVGFHFDPLIEYPGWRADYEQTLDWVFDRIDRRGVAWVSFGSLRLTPGLRKIMRRRFPDTRLLGGEHVACADGKWRTFQPLRVTMYRCLTERLRDVAPDVPVYMCMETPTVWRKVFGSAPACDKDVARGLTQPHLG